MQHLHFWKMKPFMVCMIFNPLNLMEKCWLKLSDFSSTHQRCFWWVISGIAISICMKIITGRKYMYYYIINIIKLQLPVLVSLLWCKAYPCYGLSGLYLVLWWPHILLWLFAPFGYHNFSWLPNHLKIPSYFYFFYSHPTGQIFLKLTARLFFAIPFA